MKYQIPVYAVIRIDNFLPPEYDGRFTVKEIVLSQEDAVKEVDRLNLLAKDKDIKYIWQYTRIKKMSEREMFEKSFQRPCNYFQLSGADQWSIDERLGILDWNGDGLSEEDKTRFHNHYKDCK